MKSLHIAALSLRKLPRRNSSGRRAFSAAGFSLLEMMVVITIILILASMAAVRYEHSVQRSKEAVLKQDLFIMRNAIQQYTLDKEAGPSSLEDLSTGKYISVVPKDPITNNKEWKTESEAVLLDPQQTSPGITDVHSSSDLVSLEGTPYSSW